jgi:capsular polysaccharide biosynthesis protein
MGLLDNSEPKLRWGRMPGFRDDLVIIRDRGLGKLRRDAATAPLYCPALRPAGRRLRVTSGLGSVESQSTISHHEVLPPRYVQRGTDEPLQVPALLAFEISPARLLTDGSLFRGIVARDDILIAEVSADHRSPAGEWRSFRRIQRLPRNMQLDSAISLLTGAGGADNFGHWLYDVLPRFHLAEKAGLVRHEDLYLVPRIDREFKRTTLDLLGIPTDRCVEVAAPIVIDAQRLAVSAGHRNHGRIEPWIPSFLRERFLGQPPQTGRRIYINRRDTKIRRILNEPDLESALKARGFESISMAEFDFLEKVALYASADFVLAPHGSGLAGLAFCQPGAKVMELTGGDWYNPWFEDIAAAVELDYRAVPAASAVSSRLLPDIVRHLEIDIGRVMDGLDAMAA